MTPILVKVRPLSGTRTPSSGSMWRAFTNVGNVHFEARSRHSVVGTLARQLVAAGIATVIWSTGFRTDYNWIEVPIFDGRGYPVHKRGVTAAEGLYFLGLPWLYTWGSGRFSGVARDAEYLAEHIEARVGMNRAQREAALNEAAIGS